MAFDVAGLDGYGLDMARRLLDKNWNLVLVDVDERRLAATPREWDGHPKVGTLFCGGGVEWRRCRGETF